MEELSEREPNRPLNVRILADPLAWPPASHYENLRSRRKLAPQLECQEAEKAWSWAQDVQEAIPRSHEGPFR